MKQIPILFLKPKRGKDSCQSVYFKANETNIASCLRSSHMTDFTSDGINGVLLEGGGNLNQETDGLPIREATKQGYKMAYPGDSVNLGMPTSKTRRGRVGSQIANTLTTQEEMGVVVNVEDHQMPKYRIRKLTPRECLRLQGFPDEYIDKILATVSNTQAYKQAGNAVTVSVARAIGERLMEIITEESGEEIENL